ncbi:Pheromone-regulated membrane protein [Ceratobasidium theobromae]|uniref:Pheromone-regulated membrane protein n=1 Tax=Ceratobasidium theobromae TaxID=1582974 RepID=A0A5N5QGV1_9AGAM|nr:Pheromone-regulated membrane protein [Ceratobasidium theobromae]
MPANYNPGVFESCDGDNDLPMGVYGTSTWYQGVSPTPAPHPVAPSSNCQTVPTVSPAPVKRSLKRRVSNSGEVAHPNSNPDPTPTVLTIMEDNNMRNSSNRRPTPAAIGADPGDSRDDSHARIAGVKRPSARDTGNILPDRANQFEAEKAPRELHECSPRASALTRIAQPGHQASAFPFGSGTRRSSFATASVATPPPTYTGTTDYRFPMTEPIQQHPQFGDSIGARGRQPSIPFHDFARELRQWGPAHSNLNYYSGPVIPPPPVGGRGLFGTYEFPGRAGIIQPQEEDDDDDDDDEKHRLANYHAQADWDPDDEYYDPEPSVATRKPHGDTILAGYRPPKGIARSLSHETEGGASSQATTTVGNEKGRKRFITENVCPMEQRRSFILVLAKALLQFQAPSHRIENQLEAAARVLEVPAEFLHLPSLVIVSFGSLDGEKGAPTTDKQQKFSTCSGVLKTAIVTALLEKPKGCNFDSGDTWSDCKNEAHLGNDDPTTGATFGIRVHIIKTGGRLELGKLHELHTIYRNVVHDELSAQDGRIKLLKLLKQPAIYSPYERCIHAFLCGLLICVMSFGGSFTDMWIAGAGSASIAYLQLNVATKNPMYSNIFEISAAMMMSFVARGLSSINGNLFCYSAISSAGVVLILPGSIVLASSLELASRNIISGSVKMVYAVVYALFLGFSLTIGSDLYYLVDRSARPRMVAALANVTDSYDLPGVFTDDNGQIIFAGAFTFLKPAASVTNTIKYVSKGCTRRVDGPWYLRQSPIWTLFILVPIYSVISSLWKLQPFRSKQLVVMVIISCCSYAANKAANRYIFNRSDVVSAIGAFVTGILGNAYARIFRGTAFTAMVTAVSFLVPSGIAAAGGLAQTYENSAGDQYSTGLALGFRMVQVAIGCTVGLFGAGVVVYSFGARKRSGYFAF